MDLKNVFRRGPAEVIRSLLDLKQSLDPLCIGDIQPTSEVRALRPWEEFDEYIVRWAAFANVVATPAVFSGAQIFPDPSVLPKGSIMTVDYIRNFSAIGLQVSIGAPAAGFIGGQPPDFTDARWGPRQAVPSLVFATGGPAVIPTGDLIDEVDATAGTKSVLDRPGLFISETLHPSASAQDEALTIVGNVVNTAVRFYFGGRIIIGRN